MKISWWNIVWIQVCVTGIIIWLYPYMINAYNYLVRFLKKKKKPDKKKNESNSSETKPLHPSGVMGSTKTLLPKAPEKEVTEEKEIEETEDQPDQPIMSYTLKQVIPENVEVHPEPDDYEIEYGEDPNYKIFKQDHPDYNPYLAEADTSGFSKGFTFEDLGHAVEVVKGEKNSEEDRDKAAVTLMEIEDTDMIQFTLLISDSHVVIEGIIHDHLKRNSGPRAAQNAAFDIQQYVS